MAWFSTSFQQVVVMEMVLQRWRRSVSRFQRDDGIRNQYVGGGLICRRVQMKS